MGIGDYLPIYDSGRKKLRDEGSKDGKSRAESDYPTYIFRDKQQVEQQAAERFSEEFNYPEKFLHELQKMTDSMWKDYHKNLGLSREKTWKEVKTDTIDKAQRAVNIWKSHISEARHQYVIAYVVAYFEYIEKEDARRAPPPPKPTSQPATPKPEHYTYNTGLSEGRKIIRDRGKNDGVKEAEAMYPDVLRSRAEIDKLGRTMIDKWFTANRDRLVRNYTDDREEHDSLYVTGFVSGYEEEVAKRDEKAGGKPQSAEISPTGATISVTRENHTADTHSYWLKLADPRYFDEAYDAPEPLTFDFSEALASDTSAEAASSSSGTFAYSSSDVIPLPEYTSKTPQKKKPRIYWGKR